MISFSINGVEKDLPIPKENSFRQLLQVFRASLSPERELISSIVVNGEELTENLEKVLAPVPVAQIETIEICTVHPRQLAEETLEALLTFCDDLYCLCREMTEEKSKTEFESRLLGLIDGLAVFVETIQIIRKVLHIGLLQQVEVLYVDLQSILQDLLELRKKGSSVEGIHGLISVHLSENLELWRDMGIQRLIDSTNSS